MFKPTVSLKIIVTLQSAFIDFQFFKVGRGCLWFQGPGQNRFLLAAAARETQQVRRWFAAGSEAVGNESPRPWFSAIKPQIMTEALMHLFNC